MIPNILSDNTFSSSERPYNNYVTPFEVVTDVTAEPVTLEEVKRHLRVDFTDDDVYIQGMISEAREQIEDENNVGLAPKTWKIGLRNEKGNIKLPYWTPEGTLTEITDKEGDVVEAASYDFYNGVLETAFSDIVYAEYTTGFVTCPARYKRKILERVAYLYNQRGDSAKNTSGIWL
jgi:hypothetical protein